MTTPGLVYGQHARHIEEQGECWLWRGSLRGTAKTPYLYTGTGYQRVLTHATNEWGRVLGIDWALCVDPRARMACLNKTCVNPEHAVDDMSEPGRMVFIHESSVVEGSCQIWTGTYNGEHPVMVVRDEDTGLNTRMQVRKFVWCVENIAVGVEWPEGGRYMTYCGDNSCVKAEHILYDSLETYSGWTAATVESLMDMS